MHFALSFKTEKQEREFKTVDARVQAIVLFSAYIMKVQYDHDAVVTSVFRDKNEQSLLVASGHGVPNSPHEDWRAADIRLRDFLKKDKVPNLVNIINATFPRNDAFKTALAHGTGDNFHLHIQVPKRR